MLRLEEQSSLQDGQLSLKTAGCQLVAVNGVEESKSTQWKNHQARISNDQKEVKLIIYLTYLKDKMKQATKYFRRWWTKHSYWVKHETVKEEPARRSTVEQWRFLFLSTLVGTLYHVLHKSKNTWSYKHDCIILAHDAARCLVIPICDLFQCSLITDIQFICSRYVVYFKYIVTVFAAILHCKL